MRHRDRADDGEAEPGAPPRPVGRGPREALERAGKEVGREAGAIVPYVQLDRPRRTGSCLKAHLSRSVPQGVVDQVSERLLETQPVLSAAVILLVAAGTGGIASGASPAGGAPGSTLRFSAQVDNPWFPLTPGTTAVYAGAKDGKRARDVVRATRSTKTIEGAPCRVVEDRLYLDGWLAERTTDWYTQDRAGNVWYFGESTATLDRQGRVTSTEGSWQAGADGAEPGIFMPAHPRLGGTYRQELYRGHAEDHFTIVGLFASTVSTPTANALLTREWTPLEPGALDDKLYVRGIGTVVERSVKGGSEYLELVALRRNA